MDQMEYLLGIHTFKGRSEDELDVERGEYIEVLEDDSAFNDSWYFGRNLTSFRTGLFPKAFTTEVERLPADVLKRVDEYDAKFNAAPQMADPGRSLAPLSVPSGAQTTPQVNPVEPAPLSHTQPLGPQITNQPAISPVPQPSPTVNSPVTSPGQQLNGSRTPQTPQAPNDVMMWSPQQVSQHFAALGLHEDAGKFAVHQVTGEILLEMDRETLKEVDIASFGVRFQIEKEIRAMRRAAGFQVEPESFPGTPSMPNGPVASPSTISTPYLHQAVSSRSLSYTNPNVVPNGGPGYGYQNYGYQNYGYQNYPNTYANPGSPYSNQYGSVSAVSTVGNANSTSNLSSRNGNYAYTTTSKAYLPQKENSEELTGSLTSNFSMPNTNGNANGNSRGHHRKSSSMSRYSGHQRTKTLEDWESGLIPTASESNLSPRHQRNVSTGTTGTVGSASGSTHSRTPSHTRTISSDSKNRRSSIFSRLSVSPRKKSFEVVSGSTKSRTHTPSNSWGGSTSLSSAANASTTTVTAPSVKQNLTPKIDGGSLGSSNSPSLTPSGSVQSPSLASPATVASHSNQKDSPSSPKIAGGGTFSKLRPALQKTKTSAFQEGIQHVTAQQAAEVADRAGWMHKRGGNGIGVWSKRYFTLKGTRLSYFVTFQDTKEKGLIDITGYRVVSIKDHELLVSLTAAGMGAGRYCFKLVPPGPGYKKGVAFTAPKVHYFAVDSPEELREWQSALMTATIERDDSQPVQTTCKLPTVSLPKAQELMAERLRTKGQIGSLTK